MTFLGACAALQRVLLSLANSHIRNQITLQFQFRTPQINEGSEFLDARSFHFDFQAPLKLRSSAPPAASLGFHFLQPFNVTILYTTHLLSYLLFVY